jgi:hypothetical protein
MKVWRKNSTVWSRMTESVGNNEIWQIWNLPWTIHFCNNINITDITKSVFQCRLKLKTPVSANYETKNTSTFNCFIANRLSHSWSRCICYSEQKWFYVLWLVCLPYCVRQGFIFNLWQFNQILKWHWRPECFARDSTYMQTKILPCIQSIRRSRFGNTFVSKSKAFFDLNNFWSHGTIILCYYPYAKYTYFWTEADARFDSKTIAFLSKSGSVLFLENVCMM